MRYRQIVNQPSSQSCRISKMAAANNIARDRLLCIIEIIKLLGFADTQAEFARRFLNVSDVDLQYFLSGMTRHLDKVELDHMQAKLNIGSETIAGEVQAAIGRDLWLMASARNDLMQIAQGHFNELSRKLAESNF